MISDFGWTTIVALMCLGLLGATAAWLFYETWR